jgi:hypothetical protein
MKNIKNQLGLTLALVLTLAVTSCKKDSCDKDPKQVEIELTIDETSVAMADSLGDFIENPILSEATESLDLQIMSIPEVLDTDYFIFVEGVSPNRRLRLSDHIHRS